MGLSYGNECIKITILQYNNTYSDKLKIIKARDIVFSSYSNIKIIKSGINK